MFLSKESLFEAFSQFKEREDYQKRRSELEELSKIEVNFSPPQVKKNEQILSFYQNLDGWTDEDKENVKGMCQMYHGKMIENDGECYFYTTAFRSFKEYILYYDQLKKVEEYLRGEIEMDMDTVITLSEADYIGLNMISSYVLVSIFSQE